VLAPTENLSDVGLSAPTTSLPPASGHGHETVWTPGSGDELESVEVDAPLTSASKNRLNKHWTDNGHMKVSSNKPGNLKCKYQYQYKYKYKYKYELSRDRLNSDVRG